MNVFNIGEAKLAGLKKLKLSEKTYNEIVGKRKIHEEVTPTVEENNDINYPTKMESETIVNNVMPNTMVHDVPNDVSIPTINANEPLNKKYKSKRDITNRLKEPEEKINLENVVSNNNSIANDINESFAAAEEAKESVTEPNIATEETQEKVSIYGNTGNPIFGSTNPTIKEKVVEKETTPEQKANDLIDKLSVTTNPPVEAHTFTSSINDNKSANEYSFRYSVIDDIRRDKEENDRLRQDIDQTTSGYKALDEQAKQIENDIDTIAKEAQERVKADRAKYEKELQQAKQEEEKKQNQIKDLKEYRKSLLEAINDTGVERKVTPIVSSGRTM